MKYCPNCGNPTMEEEKYCARCGIKLNSTGELKPLNNTLQQSPGTVSTKKKHSDVSIWAFVLSVSIVVSYLGAILGIIDLLTKKRDTEHTHELSIAAVIVGLLFTFYVVVIIYNGRSV